MSQRLSIHAKHLFQLALAALLAVSMSTAPFPGNMRVASADPIMSLSGPSIIAVAGSYVGGTKGCGGSSWSDCRTNFAYRLGGTAVGKNNCNLAQSWAISDTTGTLDPNLLTIQYFTMSPSSTVTIIGNFEVPLTASAFSPYDRSEMTNVGLINFPMINDAMGYGGGGDTYNIAMNRGVAIGYYGNAFLSFYRSGSNVLTAMEDEHSWSSFTSTDIREVASVVTFTLQFESGLDATGAPLSVGGRMRYSLNGGPFGVWDNNTRDFVNYSSTLQLKATTNGGSRLTATYGTVTLYPQPAVVYVDDDWSATQIGADPDGAGSAIAYGYDAFSSIQEAVNAVTAGGTVNVAAGSYAENVLLNKSVTLIGSGSPTATSFTLASGMLLGGSTSGISAPTVNVNQGARIQDGIRLASTAAQVNVAAGTYAENVVVNKALLLRGANAGVSGDAARGVETVIDGSVAGTPLSISAANVTIDGLMAVNGQGAADAGISVGTGVVGAQVVNNIVMSNTIGVKAEGAVILARNRIAQNTLGMSIGRTGASPFSVAATSNTITGNLAVGIVLTGSAPLTATLGGSPGEANTFRNNGLGGGEHVSVTLPSSNAPVEAVYNDWDAASLASIEGRIHHVVDQPGLAEVRYFGVLIDGALTGLGAGGTATATVTGNVTGLFAPAGTVISFTSDVGTLNPAAGTANAAGSASSTLVAPVGTVNVTATVGMSAGNPKSSSASLRLGVHHFVLSPIGSQIAGQDFTITITATDAGGQQMPYGGSANLSDSSSSIAPVSVGPFTNGVWSGAVSVTQAIAGDIVTATLPGSPSVAGSSNAFAVSNAALARVTVLPNPVNLTVSATQAFVASGADRFGNPVSIAPVWQTNGGQINATGFYTAQATANNGRLVTATVGSISGTAIVNVLDRPIAGLQAASTSPTSFGAATHFTATLSDGTGVAFQWSFGDGGSATGQWVSHVYGSKGLFTATLTATNSVGNAVARIPVTITNNAPAVSAGANANLNEGDALVRAITITDPDPDTWTVTVTYGDGTAPQVVITTAQVLTTNHVYTQPATYTVTTAVVDGDGGAGNASFSVVVANVPPSAVDARGPYTSTAGQPITLTGTANCAAVDACAYQWDLDGDGAFGETGEVGASVVYTWYTVGVYTPTLRVTDEEGSAVTDSAGVTVQGAVSHIDLLPGWNLVSFNLLPINTAITEVLSGISGNYDLVYAWDATQQQWLRYDNQPGSPDTLHQLQPAIGFWIQITAPATQTLAVTGSVPVTLVVTLHPNGSGWNLIGYPRSAPGSLPQALEAITANAAFELVYSYLAGDSRDPWKLYDPSATWSNDLAGLAPGAGYWVKASVNR